MKIKTIAVIAVIAVFLSPPAIDNAFAAEFRSGKTVIIEKDEVVYDDLVLNGGEMIIEGTVEGDVIAIGETVAVTGEIRGDLMAAGKKIGIDGTVTDDVRMGGQVMALGDSAYIGDDIMTGGFAFESKKGSTVKGNIFFGGYQALIGGTVESSIRAACSGLQINGEIGGDVSADVEGKDPSSSIFIYMPFSPSVPAVPPGLTVSDEAVIGGDLTYESPDEMDIPAGTVLGETIYKPQHRVPAQPEREPTAAERFTDKSIETGKRFAALLIVGMLLLWIFPRWSEKMYVNLKSKPFQSFGWGLLGLAAYFLSFVVILVAVILLAVIFFAVRLKGLAALSILFGVLSEFTVFVGGILIIGYITKIIACYAGGKLLLSRTVPGWGETRFWPLALGLVIFLILSAVPVLGWLVYTVVMLLGLGAVVISVFPGKKVQAAV